MNRTDFYRVFAAENGANQAESKETCIAVFDLLARCIKDNDRVYIKGLGTFRKKALKERRVGNINGGGVIVIPASEKIIFEPYNGSSEEGE